MTANGITINKTNDVKTIMIALSNIVKLFISVPMVCVVRVGQHAGNQAVNCGEPLDDFEPIVLVDGEAHLFSYSVGAFDGAGKRNKLIGA